MTEIAEELKDKIDPYVARIANQIGTSIESIVEPEKIEEPNDGIVMMHEPIGSATMPNLPDKVENQEKPAGQEAPKAQDATVAAPVVPAATTPQPAQTVVKLVKREDVQPAKATELSQEEKDAAERERIRDEYIKSLTPEQQEEIQIARYAESKGKAGLVDKLVDYAHKVDKFIEEHPDVSPDSEDFDKFCKENRPEWSDTERRKAEREMIKAETRDEIRQEVAQELEPQKRELRKIQSEPVIRKSIGDTVSILTTKTDVLKDMEVFDKGLVDKIVAGDYAKAVEENPVESPIISGTVNAVKSWVSIASGVVPVDAKNPMHDWIIGFIVGETSKMANAPKEQQIVDGRQFVSMAEYDRIRAQQPEKLDSVWTFSTEDIVQRISNNGIVVLNSENERLKKAGYERKPKQADVNNNQPATTQTSTRSPRATTTPSPGAAENKPINQELLAQMPHLKSVFDQMSKG